MNGYNTNKPDECVTVSYTNRIEFYNWCHDNKIVCQYEGTLNPGQFHSGIELWYIKDISHRNWAKLRWS